MKQNLPNAVATLVLGICSVVFGCLYIGFIPGIVALVISGASVKLYRANPNEWEGYGMLNAGRILSIIGIVLNGLLLIWLILIFLLVGAASLTAFPWDSL